MFKKFSAILIAGAFIFSLAIPAFAQEAGQSEAKEDMLAPKAEDAGNKICPVTGAKIDDKAKVTYEYQGKIYNFCCAGCPEEFKKDPEKYIQKVDQELKAGSEEKPATKMIMPELDMSNDRPEDSHHH